MSRFVKEEGWPGLLLVEGPEDSEVVCALLQTQGIVRRFDVREEDGLANLKQSFVTRLKSTNVLRRLWVLADADTDCNAVWQMLRDCLINNGGYEIDVHTSLPAGGAVFEPQNPEEITVGIWIMPDNCCPGMVESFIEMLVKSDDTLIGEARATVERLDAERHKHKNIFKTVHKPKAVIHTWLAWNNKPGRSMGTAILKKLIETDGPLCNSFMEWLMKLQTVG